MFNIWDQEKSDKIYPIYLPKLLINNELIPASKSGESFRYLGKYFDFSMSEKEHKQELITLMDDLMSEIDLKPLHPKNKLLLYSRYLLSKLSWHFTVTTISKTWVSENMDSVVNKYVRKWLEIPISGTLSNVYQYQQQVWSKYLPAVN